MSDSVARLHFRKNVKSQSTAAALQSIDWSRNFTIEFFDLSTNEPLVRAPERRGPCACIDLNCGCCAGMNIQQFNFKRIRECDFCVQALAARARERERENAIYFLMNFSLHQFHVRPERIFSQSEYDDER